MGDRLNLKLSHRLVRGFSLPTRPPEMLEAIKTQSAFVQTPPEVMAVIVRDLALAARILQAANTLLTGHNRQVGSIESARVLLGQEKVREITHELFLEVDIARKASWMQTQRLRAVRAARLTAWLAREVTRLSPGIQSGHLPVVPHEEAYVLGLFHDCGKMVLLRHFADYPDLLTQERDVTRQPLEALEMAQYQTHHAVLGGLLAESWQLPRPLVHLIETHHQPDTFAGRPVSERPYLLLHAILFMTEWLEGDLTAWEWEQHRDHFQQLFGLDDDRLRHLQEQAVVEIGAADGQVPGPANNRSTLGGDDFKPRQRGQ
ncbi:MAG: HDOD domain-containing protein [Magnetococcus sp. DMHC-8]